VQCPIAVHRCGPGCSLGWKSTPAAFEFCCWTTQSGSRPQHCSCCGRTCGC
jgi:hypothetical protein